jgi:PAS domain S-box-containing protein
MPAPVLPQQLLESAIAQQRDAILITEADRIDPGGRRIVFINPAFTAMTGFTPEDALGKTPQITVGEKTDRATLQRIQAAIEHKSPVREEVFKYKKDGTPFWVEIDIAPVVEADGRCRYLVCVMRDISDKKQLQARLVESDRMAALGTLAAGVAHEINNPLAYVLSNLELATRQAARLEQAAPGLALDELHGALADALHGVERMTRLVRDLRTFSRADALETGPVELSGVLDSCIGIVRHQARHRTNLVREYAEARPAQGNESRFAQVFLNLLVNAVQAIPEGNPEAHEVRVRLYDDAGPMVRVEVQDTGEGIAAEVLPRIFEPFFTTKPVGVGTGFGLAIAHGIVSAFGGTIEVQSELGRGSRFRVALPAAIVPALDPPAAHAEAAARRARVLIVDDEGHLLRSLTRLLEAEHDVVVAGGGLEALAVLGRDFAFDLILCDLMMPAMSGIELYRRVRAGWPGLERRVAFMTGGTLTSEVTEFLNGVANPRLEKPLSVATLSGLLRDAIASPG